MIWWLFQGFTEIQIGRHRSISIFLGGAKTQKNCLVIFFNFNITFLSTCGCAIDATKIQNGRQKSTPNFFVGAETLKLGRQKSTPKFLWAQKL